MSAPTNSQTTIMAATSKRTTSSAPHFPRGQDGSDIHSSRAVGDTSLPETIAGATPKEDLSPAPNLLPSQSRHDSHRRTAGQDTNSQTTNGLSGANVATSSALNSRTGHPSSDDQGMTAGSGTYFPRGHRSADAQSGPAVGDTNLPETTKASMPITTPSPAPNCLPSHVKHGPQTAVAGQDTNSQTTIVEATSRSDPSSAPYLPGATSSTSPINDSFPASDSPHGQGRPDAHLSVAVGGTKPAGDHEGRDPQTPDVSGAPTPTPDHSGSAHQRCSVRGGFLRDPVLGILADVLDDLEKVRIANENRIRQLTRTENDEDGENRGHGLTLNNPMVKKLVTSVESLAQAEKDATLNLQKAMKAHPLGPWVKSQAGVGEKQAARLLATIGDPFWNDLHDRPRTVSELWAFCGYAVHDGHAQARRRGERSNWSADAKMRTYLISVSCVKQSAEKSKYRRVYDEGRAKYADAVHPHDCKRCAPAGKPALAGSPLSAGHQHNRAIRLISKELLKDLWIASRDLYLAKEAA